jgi:hypothetical protein
MARKGRTSSAQVQAWGGAGPGGWGRRWSERAGGAATTVARNGWCGLHRGHHDEMWAGPARLGQRPPRPAVGPRACSAAARLAGGRTATGELGKKMGEELKELKRSF